MKAISYVLPGRSYFARLFSVLFLLLAVTLPPAILNAQSVTGQVSGTVVDPAGAVIAGAQVQLTNDLTKQTRGFVSEQNGSFIFTGLVPGGYSLRIAQPGFKAYEERGIAVSSQERVDLHNLRLQVGDVNTAIEVSAQTVHVQTDGSDRSLRRPGASCLARSCQLGETSRRQHLRLDHSRQRRSHRVLRRLL